jgi:hypothetical protein
MSAERIKDERTGQIYDYTRKQRVEHTEIISPLIAVPGHTINRADLWNAAEIAEKRKDGTPAREYIVALPKEFNAEKRLALTREIAKSLANRHGCVVDFAIHAPNKGKNGNNYNYHAHILTTTRKLEIVYDDENTKLALRTKCDIELSDTDRKKKGLDGRKNELIKTRKDVEVIINNHLERHKYKIRVSSKSNFAQGLEREAQIKMGPKRVYIEQRLGIKTNIGNHNREIEKFNIERESAANELQEKTKQEANRLVWKSGSDLDFISALEDAGLRSAIPYGWTDKAKADFRKGDLTNVINVCNSVKHAAQENTQKPIYLEKILPAAQEDISKVRDTPKVYWVSLYNQDESRGCGGFRTSDISKIYRLVAKTLEEWKYSNQIGSKSLYVKEMQSEKYIGPEGQEEKIDWLAEAWKTYKTSNQQEDKEKYVIQDYHSELNKLAEQVYPKKQWNEAVRNDWKKPFLKRIAADNENSETVAICLSLARHDASTEGQEKLKSMRRKLNDATMDIFSNGLEQMQFVQATMNKIRLFPDRQKALESTLDELEKSVNRVRGRSR